MGNFSKERQAKKKEAKAKKNGTFKTDIRKTIKICVIVALVIAIPLSVWLISLMKMEADRYLVESEMVINEVDTTYIEDGIYYARFDNEKMSATVGVTLTDGRMTEIAIYDYENINVSTAEALFDDVITYQMLNTPDAERNYSELILLKTLEAALQNLSTTQPSVN